ncbi:MAG TPA: hypothetical protein VFP28_10160 [Gemmatimonadales bacterium]|nr:hypothetical protein [Gemmatimonadales bacterium]
MRSYWLRILLGAFGIFCLGMIVVSIARHGRSKVESVIASSEPLSIPLPFVPFQVNGSKLGTLERLTVNRESPKKVSSIELQVKMDDSLVAKGLAGCRLAANIESDSAKPGDVNIHMNRLNEKTFFFCATQDSGFEEMGTAKLTPGDIELPLLLPESLAQHLRNGDWATNSDSTDALETRADSIANAAEAIADSASAKAERAQAKAQEKAQALSERQSRLGDSLRAEGLRRGDSIRSAMSRMADSLHAR